MDVERQYSVTVIVNGNSRLSIFRKIIFLQYRMIQFSDSPRTNLNFLISLLLTGDYGLIKLLRLQNRQFEIFYGKESYKIDLPFNFLDYWIDNENVMWFSSEGNMYRLLSSAFSIF